MRLILVIFLIFLATLAKTEETITDSDRFELWTGCESVGLDFILDTYKSSINITKEEIEPTVRSRLRGAYLYDNSSKNVELYVIVNVRGSSFSVEFDFRKPLHDYKYSKEYFYTTAWSTTISGTHSGDSGFIIQQVSRLTDLFIDDYIRVNSDHC
ncbi:MAG: hypothetical protein F4223_11505 [Rhodobacteraceae bacterium]|nr:hypothetical protein [Paracoccaceae bacterium]